MDIKTNQFSVVLTMDVKKNGAKFCKFTAEYEMSYADLVDLENLVVGGLLKQANDTVEKNK